MNRKYAPPEPGLLRLYDLVHVTDNRFKKVLYWSLRDTILVNNVDEGVRVSLGAIRRRTVTYGGHIILESGLMCANIRSVS